MLPDYVGRFAPSPTGPLHFGSLIAALASYLDARAHGGRWRVRIEDIDPPREIPGAAATILKQLDAHGLHWDGELCYQSERLPRYAAALAELVEGGYAYYCACSREQVRRTGGVHRGRCALPKNRVEDRLAVRLSLPGSCRQTFVDIFQGALCEDLKRDVGDFVLRRRDGLFAYQLAVVVDDGDQGITHVIRGADLLDSTARQRWLYSQLFLRQPPEYGHIPMATNIHGQKLSKQSHAQSLDQHLPVANLERALRWMGLVPDGEAATVDELLSWAIQRWDRSLLAGQRALAAPAGY